MSDTQPQDATADEVQADNQAQEEYHEEEPSAGGHRFLLFTAMPGWLVSMLVHAVGLFILALWPLPPPNEAVANVITASPGLEDVEEIEEFEETLLEPIDVEAFEAINEIQPMQIVADIIPQEVTEVAMANDLDAAAISVDLVDFSESTAPRSDLMQTIGSFSGKGLDGRGSAASRASAVAAYGGSEGSEAAVAAALKWIARHQLPDGGWNYDHRIGPGARLSDHAGTFTQARNAATSMAVLPFLGAGQTHMDGSYENTVKGGLAYLLTRMDRRTGSLWEGPKGRMYAHGLGAITLCEAYAMTHDRDLMQPAQMSLNFIVAAQDPVGGGWRYKPGEPGDTSVVGWQLMALKSGHLAYLKVPANTIRGAIRYLDTVQTGGGAYYGYNVPAKKDTTTAIGLLCRMYLGWEQDRKALEQGVQYLAAQGPSQQNMYYNYYATQVMRQYGGKYWDQWNDEMRDYLVETQAKSGPEAGSWFFTGGHGAADGGRLYNTSLAAMILEVYYRHLPIYQTQAASEDFPL